MFSSMPSAVHPVHSLCHGPLVTFVRGLSVDILVVRFTVKNMPRSVEYFYFSTLGYSIQVISDWLFHGQLHGWHNSRDIVHGSCMSRRTRLESLAMAFALRTCYRSYTCDGGCVMCIACHRTGMIWSDRTNNGSISGAGIVCEGAWRLDPKRWFIYNFSWQVEKKCSFLALLVPSTPWENFSFETETATTIS